MSTRAPSPVVWVLFGFIALQGASIAVGAPIVLSNATTEVTVYGGENNSNLVDYGGYLSYYDRILGEEVTWTVDPLLIFPDGSVRVLSNGSSGGFGSPVNVLSGAVGSTATVTSDDGLLTIDVTATTFLFGEYARTDFTFVSQSGPMTGTTFVWYAENDLLGFADDVAAFTGSIAGGDLTLYMFDSLAVSGGSEGLTVVLDGQAGIGAQLSLFGAGVWPTWGEALESGDLSVLSADGSNFDSGPGDLGLALAYDLTGVANSPYTSAVTAVFGTQQTLPNLAPAPGSLWLLVSGVLGAAFARRSRRKRIR